MATVLQGVGPGAGQGPYQGVEPGAYLRVELDYIQGLVCPSYLRGEGGYYICLLETTLYTLLNLHSTTKVQVLNILIRVVPDINLAGYRISGRISG